MADFETLYPGRFLKKEMLAAPKVIRILAVNVAQLEGEKGIEQKVILKYKAADGEGEMIWNKTNSMLTAYALNEREYDKWIGRLITIYNNPTVDLGGKKVGGIRVYGSPEMGAAKKVEIKRPRRKKPEVYDLFPTDTRGNKVANRATPVAKDANAEVSTIAPPPTESDMPVFDNNEPEPPINEEVTA